MSPYLMIRKLGKYIHTILPNEVEGNEKVRRGAGGAGVRRGCTTLSPQYSVF